MEKFIFQEKCKNIFALMKKWFIFILSSQGVQFNAFYESF